MTPDWDYYLRLLQAGRESAALPRIQYKFSIHANMGSYKYFDKAEAQRALLHQRHGMGSYHELFRSTLGRAMSYFANPYRSPFIPGLKREIGEAIARRSRR